LYELKTNVYIYIYGGVGLKIWITLFTKYQIQFFRFQFWWTNLTLKKKFVYMYWWKTIYFFGTRKTIFNP